MWSGPSLLSRCWAEADFRRGCVCLMLLPVSPKSPGWNMYLACAFGWARAAGTPLMLKNYTTYGTAAQTGSLNSALATSLLDLALICSFILRKFSDLFLMLSYFEKYPFPSSLCMEAGGD